jgi:23S rRNA pseudouridine1911/1915/1917 synthase
MTLFVEKEDEHTRLDHFLKKHYPSFSRTYFQRLIKHKLVLVNGAKLKKGQKLKAQDEIEVEFLIDEPLKIEPEPIPLSILYEDDDLLAINKPQGMVVHPGAGNVHGTFVSALLFYLKNNPFKEHLRPGIIHRLDKETTGVLLAAKNPRMQTEMIDLFVHRRIEKHYQAICIGAPKNQTIDLPIKRDPVYRQKMKVAEGGREAISILKTVAYNDTLALVDVEIKTGRTHQIRVHLKAIGHPILGDPVYGNTHLNKKLNAKALYLHATKVCFIHPLSKKNLTIEAPLPPHFEKILNIF